MITETILAGAILFLALWVLFKNLRETGKGEGCSNCDGCSGGCNVNGKTHKSSGIEILPSKKNPAKKIKQ